MRVAITGATGYIGGRLATKLSRHAQVWAIVRAGGATRVPAGVRTIDDPGTAEGLAQLFSEHEIEAVAHLAAHQSPGRSPSDSDALVDANVALAARLLSGALASGARGVVLTGTYSQYAAGSESYEPNTLYAATKQAASDIAYYYASKTRLRTVSLDLGDVYGPHDPRVKFLNLLSDAASTGARLDATAGEQRLAPIHVDDVISAFERALELVCGDEPLARSYSVAGPEVVSLRELHGRFCRATGTCPVVNWGAKPYTDAVIMEPFVGPALSGWSPSYSLDEGLAAVYGKGA